MMQQIGKIAGALSPIHLFRMDQLNKLSQQSNGVRSYVRGLGDLFAAGARSIERQVSTHGKQKASISSIGEYMQGYSVGDRLDLSQSTQDFRAMVRKRAAMGIGAYAGSSLLFGSDGFIPSTMRAGATLGMHGGIAYGLSKIHPMAGVAYAGLGVMNVMRSGDNIGPY